MSGYVIDASVVVKWFLPEPDAEAARRLRRGNVECSAPELLFLEVLNVLWKHYIRGNLELEVARGAVEALAMAPIQSRAIETLFADAFRLATETRRSVYDCSYLALAIETARPLVTADRKFHDAIKAGPYAPHLLWVGDLLHSV